MPLHASFIDRSEADRTSRSALCNLIRSKKVNTIECEMPTASERERDLFMGMGTCADYYGAEYDEMAPFIEKNTRDPLWYTRIGNVNEREYG